MIPKVINFCWFGYGEYPDVVEKCIDSWKRNCPDYEIKLWDESNYDVRKNQYVREAYENKKWAFVSDYVRLDILYEFGGFYLDTDVELVKSLDELTKLSAFVATDGSGINTGLGFGAEPHNPIIGRMLALYDNQRFIINGKCNLTPCTKLNSKIFIENGYDKSNYNVQTILGVKILPAEYFSPIEGKYSELKITDNTYGIHWGSRLWETGWTRLKAKLRLLLGPKLVNHIKRMIKR